MQPAVWVGAVEGSWIRGVKTHHITC